MTCDLILTEPLTASEQFQFNALCGFQSVSNFASRWDDEEVTSLTIRLIIKIEPGSISVNISVYDCLHLFFYPRLYSCSCVFSVATVQFHTNFAIMNFMNRHFLVYWKS